MTRLTERPEWAALGAHHEELKDALAFALGIAAGYELELHGLLRDGDRVAAVERIASVGEPGATLLGPGRRWVIENVMRRAFTGPASTGEFVRRRLKCAKVERGSRSCRGV